MSSSHFWDPSFPFAPSRIPFFYGWVIVAIATVTTVFSIPGQTMGFSVFTDVLIEELGLSRLQLSTAYFVGTVLSGFSLPYFGRLFDRHGSRRMILYSTCATGVVLIYLSQTHRISDLVAQALPFVQPVVWSFLVITFGFLMIRASAQGVLTMTARIAMGKWFDRQRGLAQSLSGVLVSFSFSLSPRFLDWLIERAGWSGAWMLMGIITITVMGSLGWLFFRDNPEECGMLMDGGPSKKPPRRVNLDMVITREFTRPEALRTPVFWFYNLSFSYHSLFGTAFTFHIISIGSSFSLSKDTVLGFFVPMAICSVFWNLFCGWINPHIRLKYLLISMNIASLGSTIGAMNLDRTWGVVAFILGMGIASGSFVTLSGLVWPRYYGRRWLGAISGIGMSSMVIASGLGPILFSLSLHWFQNYNPIILICAAVPALLLFCSFWAENPQRKL